MNSLQRVLAAVQLEAVDRPPVIPVMLMQGARELELTLPQYFERPHRLAEGQLRLLDRFGHDGVFAIPHIVQDVLPWDSALTFHEDGPPSVGKMVIREWDDILHMPVPDPASHPYLRHTLTAAEELVRQTGGEVPVIGGIIGPFSLPTMLMGTRKFLELLDKPELRERYYKPLMDKMVEYAVRWTRAQFDAGCHIVVFAEGIASATIIDESTFLRWARPVMEQYVRGVRRALAGLGPRRGPASGPYAAGGQGAGNGSASAPIALDRTEALVLEFVGHGLPYMGHVRDLDVAGFLIGESDPVEETRAAVGRQKAIMGNINNLKLLRWDPERVEFEARRVVARAGAGFILSNQGPDVPWHVPYPAIEALVRAAAD